VIGVITGVEAGLKFQLIEVAIFEFISEFKIW